MANSSIFHLNKQSVDYALITTFLHSLLGYDKIKENPGDLVEIDFDHLLKNSTSEFVKLTRNIDKVTKYIHQIHNSGPTYIPEEILKEIVDKSYFESDFTKPKNTPFEIIDHFKQIENGSIIPNSISDIAMSKHSINAKRDDINIKYRVGNHNHEE